MINSEMKSSAQKSNLRDASSSTQSSPSTSSSPASSSSTITDQFNTFKETATHFANDASPKVKEAFGQVSDVAGDLYSKANTWLKTGNNKSYGYYALVAAVGFAGFLVGRGTSSSTSSDISDL